MADEYKSLKEVANSVKNLDVDFEAWVRAVSRDSSGTSLWVMISTLLDHS